MRTGTCNNSYAHDYASALTCRDRGDANPVGSWGNESVRSGVDPPHARTDKTRAAMVVAACPTAPVWPSSGFNDPDCADDPDGEVALGDEPCAAVESKSVASNPRKLLLLLLLLDAAPFRLLDGFSTLRRFASSAVPDPELPPATEDEREVSLNLRLREPVADLFESSSSSPNELVRCLVQTGLRRFSVTNVCPGGIS